MKLLTPSFTFQFQCIADKCTYSCCKGWSIFFTEREREKFIKFGITDIDELSNQSEPEQYEMKYDDHGNCPYLEESGLCRMITTCGNDEVLCNTCQTFPRIIKPKNEYIEYTISNACPAVIEILRNTPCPITFEIVDYDDPIEAKAHLPQHLISCRDSIIDLMQISDFPIWLRLYIIFTFAGKIKNHTHSDTYSLIQQYNSTDYLLEICNELLHININLTAKLQLMVNYLAITNKRDSTNTYEKYINELYNNALQLEVKYLSDSFLQFEKIYSNYSSLIENIAVNDIFRNISCDSNENLYYSTIIMLIMMSLIKFTSFLEWIDSGKDDSYNLNDNIIVYFGRKFEHISFSSLKKQALEFEDEGWLSPGNIFTLLR